MAGLPGDRTRLYSTGQVATLLFVHPDTVRRYALSGRLNAFRTLGGKFRFFAEEVDALAARIRSGEGERGWAEVEPQLR